jgi:hypothetical protein
MEDGEGKGARLLLRFVTVSEARSYVAAAVHKEETIWE